MAKIGFPDKKEKFGLKEKTFSSKKSENCQTWVVKEEDYDKVLAPAIEDEVQKYGKVRLL